MIKKCEQMIKRLKVICEESIEEFNLPELNDLLQELDESKVHLPTVVSSWVSVKDRTPCHLERIIFFNGKSIQLGLYEDVNKCWMIKGEFYLDVTHWMPLPEKPNV